ncbi:protein of unknown function DUF554 [Alkaliphilus metalliredigens QYMF]|uniref:Transport protein n=1 Tax=Alkaliphilus metalliredigens (strain QYMF) TaxID=293826 RepID=A6TLI9_ALKMQ|nr:DUF554 domain-containing protein [Alkaliphilus metalliredigens]ABR47057.1 protein of unknown function DUF554 [Alkaliphilus metalliredigens QYMF]
MLGTIYNVIAIIVGALLGVILRKGIPEGHKKTIMQGIGLSVMVIGLSGALKTENILLMVFSIVIGGVIGEALCIEKRLDGVGDWLESKVGQRGGSVAKAFVTTSLIYCVGAMAIVGALESGLTGNHQTLYAKSLIDGVSSIIFASTLGIGVIFSAVPVFLYQGFIATTAGLIEPLLTNAVINEMSAIGGLLIVGIAFNILEIKKIHVGNLLPAIFIPIFYAILQPYMVQISSVVQNLF